VKAGGNVVVILLVGSMRIFEPKGLLLYLVTVTTEMYYMYAVILHVLFNTFQALKEALTIKIAIKCSNVVNQKIL